MTLALGASRAHTDTMAAGPDDGNKPTHPHLQATLLMLGIVLFLIIVAALEVR